MTKTEKKILGITSLGHGLCHVYILSLAALLLPITKEFNLSLTALTGIGTICYFLFGIGAFPAGILTTLTNPKLMLKVFFLGSAVSAIFLGFAPNLIIFSICLAFLGLFNGIYHVAGPSMLAHHQNKIGKSFGIHGVAGSAGITIAPLLASAIAILLGWRSVYILLAIPGFIGFFLLFFDKIIPKESTNNKPKELTDTKNSIWLYFILFLVILALNGFVYRSFLTIFPIYLSKNAHLFNVNPLFTGGLLSSIILSFGMIGQYFGGLLSDKYNKLKLYFLFLLVTAPLFALMGFFSGLPLVLTGIIFSIFYFPLQPVENSIISRVTPEKFVGTIFGFKFVLSFGIGSLGAIFAGFVTDNMGMTNLFYMISAIAVLSIILVGVILNINNFRRM
ncbi:MFS transporter [Candidatus Margulisiibacteriota bacterium]